MVQENLKERFQLVDDGTMDTVVLNMKTGQEFRFDSEFSLSYRDPVSGDLDVDGLLTTLEEMGDLYEMDYNEGR